MLISSAAIVAFLLYLIAGPPTVPFRLQTRFKSLGHGIHQRISSVLSLPPAFEPQDNPIAFEATTVEALQIVPVETNVVHPIAILPPVPLEDHVQAVTPELFPTRYDGRPSPAPARVFVVSSEYQGPWHDLFNHRVLGALTAIYISIWFPLVVIPLVSKLLSRSEPLNEIKPPVDVEPKLLPPKFITPPRISHIQILNPDSSAPLGPIFSPAPPESSTFWLAPEQKQQDQPSSPSPPLLRHLDFSGLERKRTPLSSPTDSGYGTTLSDTSLDKSVITTPEHLAKPLPTTGEESTGLKGVPTTSEDVTGEVDTTGFDTELEDDDDGSTTVTSSTANLAELTRPAPILAEELAAQLGSVTVASIEEAKSFPEPPAEGLSITAPSSDNSAADLLVHNEPTMNPPSDGEPVADMGTPTEGSAADEITVDVRPPSEPSSDTTDAIMDAVCVDEEAAASTGLEAIVEEDEALVESDLPSQDILEQDVEPWVPDGEIPTIVITPPSEVDPEDFAQQLDLEEEQEESEGTLGPNFEGELEPESEHHHDSELEYGDYPVRPVIEVVLDLPPSPVELRDDPYHSPVTKSGMLWSDDEGDDLGPLPFTEAITHVERFDALEIDTPEPSDAAETTEQSRFTEVVEQVEPQGSTVEEEGSHTVTLGDSDIEEPVAETVRELVDMAPEAPAQEVTEAVPSPTRASRPHLIRTQAFFSSEDRGEGSSRGSRSLEPPRPQYYHCCKLYRSDGRPESWENWKLAKPRACIPVKTNLQEWQFVSPTDKDGANPTTRIAIDNLDADWFRTIEGVPSYNYLTEAMKFFATKYFRCWRGRTINGVEYPSIGYATVDFDSVGEAIRMFDELQGRRLRGHTWHWRLEFVDPSDDTHGGRKVIRTGLVSDSEKQALAAQLEASTRRPGKFGDSDDSSTDAAAITRPPARVRPQVSVSGRSLLAGAMANVVQDRRADEQPAQRAPRRPYRS